MRKISMGNIDHVAFRKLNYLKPIITKRLMIQDFLPLN